MAFEGEKPSQPQLFLNSKQSSCQKNADAVECAGLAEQLIPGKASTQRESKEGEGGSEQFNLHTWGTRESPQNNSLTSTPSSWPLSNRPTLAQPHCSQTILLAQPTVQPPRRAELVKHKTRQALPIRYESWANICWEEGDPGHCIIPLPCPNQQCKGTQPGGEGETQDEEEGTIFLVRL